MTETSQSAAQSVQVAKLPFFYEHNSDGLFTHIEAQFEIAGISNEETNFYHAVTALSTSASGEIQYFLQTECTSNNETLCSDLRRNAYVCTVEAKLQR